MDPRTWDRLAEIFFRATERPEEAPRLIEDLRAEDPALADELAGLLAESATAEEDDPLARIVDRAAGWLEDRRGASSTTEPGAEGGAPLGSVGPYRLIRELGRGGSGTVYLATREDEGFPLEVALKMVDRRFASSRDRERLVEERRILATLTHLNVARVFDAGTADDGTPYFVLERIDGEPIDVHCDRLRLPAERRIELFLGVCEAVAYAHRRLVIHRDIKPSNILVSGDGVPKLLDFGIAKVLDDGREGLTLAGERWLTPEFASPEQFRGEALTTATDVYSLGALLFLLLTGRPVFPLRGVRPAEAERLVCGESPGAPSEAAVQEASEGADANGLAALRQTTPARLRRRLAGDLDTIVGKALRKEPHRRYASVERLAEDLRLHLAGRPITARGDSSLYRVGRFVVRHRAAVAATGLVTLALAGGFVSTVLQMRKARIEQAKTEQVAGFLVGLFEAVDPAVARGAEPTAREILDRGGRDLLAPGHGSMGPEVQATLAGTIGRVYARLGHYDEAERLLGRALELRRRRGEEPALVARALIDLGQLHDDRRAYERAAGEIRTALDLLPAEARPGSPEALDRATALYRLASVELGRGRVEEAERSLDDALAIRKEAFGDRSLAVAEVRHSRAQVWYRTGRLEEAERELVEVLDLRRALLGEDHPASLTTLNDLASVKFDRGDTAGALALLDRTVALRAKVLGADHPYVATALLNLATVARQTGDLPRARSAAERGLTIVRKAFGEEHARSAEALSLLAKVELSAGRLPRAEELGRRALAIQRRVLGPRDVEVARTLLQLAAVVRERSATHEAERFLREALAIQEETMGSADPALSFALLPLGRLLAEKGRYAEAETQLRRALAIRQAAFPAGHRRIEEAREALAGVLSAAADRSPNR